MKQRVVEVGAGGHARVCVELLQQSGYDVVACVGTAPAEAILGAPVIAGDHHLSVLRDQGVHLAFVALGDNRLRKKLAETCSRLGYSFVNAISPHAVVSGNATMGHGVAVMPRAVVNVGAIIGDFVVVNTGATIDHDCQLGNMVHVAPQCGLAGSVTIGEGSLIGIGSSLLPGTRVGRYAVIGAGSVVTRDVPDGKVAFGTPAKVRD